MCIELNWNQDQHPDIYGNLCLTQERYWKRRGAWGTFVFLFEKSTSTACFLLKNIFHWEEIISESWLTSEAEAEDVLTIENNTVSSAENLTWDFIFIYSVEATVVYFLIILIVESLAL